MHSHSTIEHSKISSLSPIFLKKKTIKNNRTKVPQRDRELYNSYFDLGKSCYINLFSFLKYSTHKEAHKSKFRYETDKKAITSWKLHTPVLSIPLSPGEQSMSTETSGITMSSETTRSLLCSSSSWTSLDPGVPLQYRRRISEVTSKPRPRAWIELRRVIVKESELELLVVAEYSIKIEPLSGSS